MGVFWRVEKALEAGPTLSGQIKRAAQDLPGTTCEPNVRSTDLDKVASMHVPFGAR